MELLSKHFELALETPDGIKKLRELILSLAMQGKLVPQDPNDQPAFKLLEEIRTIKDGLSKEAKFKEQNTLKTIKPEDIPYSVPNSWEWVRLKEICTLITDGTHLTPKYTHNGIPFLSVKDISSGKLDFSNTKFISDGEHLELSKRCHPELNDILLTKIGTTGVAVVVNTDREFSIFVSVALLKFIHWKIDPYFLEKLINSPLVKKYSEEGTEGVGNKNLVLRKIREFIIPIPPLEEQKRIVNKIDKLMSLCDKLEAERTEISNKRLKIHASVINKLLTASDESEFNQSWNFIINNFGELYSVPENVEELKKAILELAVMGKLVSQDPKDQPASELLNDIENEKRQLVRQGMGKKEDDLPLITPEEIPYELPDSWRWVRLNDIAIYNGRVNMGPDEISSDTWVLDLEDIQKDTSVIIRRAMYGERQSRSTKSTFCKGDVLYGKLRPYLNKVVVADEDGVCTTEIVPIVPFKGIDSNFLKILLKRPSFIEHVNSLTYGVKMPRLGASDAVKSVHPLPPLAEQKRIVAKIDQLMELCNKLQQQLNDSTKKKTAILNGVLQQY